MPEVIDIYSPMEEPAPPPTAAAAPRPCRIEFTGTGAEYFRIWIVNLLLTIVTLGIYSAWAKVRKLQYFYRNTRLDGAVFDYHGDPIAILKGRGLAVVLLAAYKYAPPLLGSFGLIVVLGVLAAAPWLVAQSYRFRLHNTSYRGLRFRFDGPVRQAYLIFGPPIALLLIPGALAALVPGSDPKHPDFRVAAGIGIAYLVLMLLWPYLHFCFKRWEHGHAWYGRAHGRFEARPWHFYRTYLAAAGIVLLCLIPAVLLVRWNVATFKAGGRPGAAFSLLFAFGFVFYAALIAAGIFARAKLQNLVWSHTRLGEIGLASDVRPGRLIGITFGNLLMVAFSLGLLIPHALTRVMKYRIESIQVLDAAALGKVAADAGTGPVGATGEGAVDLMDLDIGL
ncbi:MAG: DUF898 domain-containing protein [Burkholderiaceae bacterium]|nr:DUF898 domain-containing protein [Burkholderiaceae bacterium]